MSERTFSLIGVLVIVLFAAVATTIATAQKGGETPANPSESPEKVVRDLVDSDGNLFGPDRQLAKIATDHDGGFGGFYFDETDSSIAYVFMTDPTEVAAAKAALRAAYDGSRNITTITPVQGAYAFNDLLAWYTQLDHALVAAGIHPSSGAVLEIKNRIQFGLPDADQFDDARKVMSELEIPPGAVEFVEQDYGVLLDKGDVTEEWRPVVGGIQHEMEGGNNRCTIGFATERAARRVMDGVAEQMELWTG